MIIVKSADRLWRNYLLRKKLRLVLQNINSVKNAVLYTRIISKEQKKMSSQNFIKNVLLIKKTLAMSPEQKRLFL